MAHDVFISHSSVNKTAADAICHALEQNGVKCWIAPRDISPGSNYGAEIIKGIKECGLFLLVFSREVNNSPAVQKEVERAVLGYKKTVIPFRIEDVAMNENLEFFLTDVHWLDAFPDDTIFENLITAVKNALGMGAAPVSAPTPVQRQEAYAVEAPKPADTLAHDDTSASNYIAGEFITFGNYEWLVLEVQKGYALIISKNIISQQPYDTVERRYPSWEKSSLRQYLNDDFYNSFTKNEQLRIVDTNSESLEYFVTSSEWGEEGLGKIFCLSSGYVFEHFVGENAEFCEYLEQNWWLRKGNAYSAYAFVNDLTLAGGSDKSMATKPFGIRPAMWVKIGVQETPPRVIAAPIIPSGIPEGAEVFAPKGVITVVTDEGSEMKGIASGAFVGSGFEQLVFGDLNLELPLAELKSIKADPYGMGEARIVMMSGEEHTVEFESCDSISFISAEKPYSLTKLSCLEISSLVFDRETIPNVDLEYISIECYDGKTIAVPSSFFEFSYFGWNPIKGMKSYSGQPVTYSYPNLLLSEKAALPFEEIEIPIEEIASYHIKDMGNQWYKVIVTKKTGELILLKTYQDFVISVYFITNNGKEKLGLNEIKRITFLPLSS
jgi:hypothetical protein